LTRRSCARQVIALSKPGSGKSISAVTSVISSVISRNAKPRNGTTAIILTPTRESALRLLGVASELVSNAPQTVGVATDESNILPEVKRLENGVNVLIATPRRLLQHLYTTPAFVVRNLKTLIVDDADRMSKLAGIRETLALINQALVKKKQVALFSTETIDEAILETLKLDSPRHVLVDESQHSGPATGQVQGYVVIDPEKRFLLLYSFLEKFRQKKTIVVLSSTAAAKGYADVLNALGLSVFEVHGKQTTRKQTSSYFEFKKAQEGILLCTDVTLRGSEVI
jgi:ATP-dependent RNA helicase DDX18/HAS1